MASPANRVLLPSFGAHIFGLEPDPCLPSMHVPPLIAGPYGLDLDYSALLLFDSMLIDKAARQFVNSADVKILRQLKESLHILGEEGQAEFIDYAEITKKTSTPTKPPEKPGTPAWKRSTGKIATARKPSMSGR